MTDNNQTNGPPGGRRGRVADSGPAGRGASAAGPSAQHPDEAPMRDDATLTVERERDRFGGVKVGSAFFGWLTATGMFVLLTALLTAAGAAIGLAQSDAAVEDAAGAITDPGTAETVGIVSAIVLLLVLFLAYYAGGYVAGRMARFDGVKQGVAVWVWALVIAVVLAVVGAVAGSQFDVLASTGALPRIPVNEGDLTTGGIIAAVVALVVSLVGAVLGGMSGARYHRKVDEAGFGRRPRLS